jgi:hypothetical protein
MTCNNGGIRAKISELVKNVPHPRQFCTFSSLTRNFLWVKAVQERLLMDTDLTG